MGDTIPESGPPSPIVVVVATERSGATVAGQPDSTAPAVDGAVAVARSLGSAEVTVITQDASVEYAEQFVPVAEVGIRVAEGTAMNWTVVLAGLLEQADRTIVVADSDSVISTSLARSVAAAGSTSVVVAALDDANVVGAISGVPVQIDRGLVDRPAASGSARTVAMSWLVVSARDAVSVASVLETMPVGGARRVSEVLVPAILRAGIALRAVPPRHHPIGSAVETGAAAVLEDALDRADADSNRIASAVKAADGPFATYCVSPYSRFIAAFGARRGWTPNGVTAFSLVLGLAAALCFLNDRTGILALGTFLLISSFVFDCVDGQLARITLNFSSRGAWLDLYSDRLKEFAMVAALAAGAGSSR
ncbi:MAG: CDP-alcohol phosphatidyltransferase family protein, partial [Actinomycetota bacterium]|nr:CDP-alcohol phosphatidyltransferase family protein [Actinomycetota bacterium]